jgi:hypothetical protein
MRNSYIFAIEVPPKFGQFIDDFGSKVLLAPKGAERELIHAVIFEFNSLLRLLFSNNSTDSTIASRFCSFADSKTLPKSQ